MRTCPNARKVGGTCLNLGLFAISMECSLVPNSICMIHAEEAIKSGFASPRLKQRIAQAKKLGVYNETAGCIALPLEEES